MTRANHARDSPADISSIQQSMMHFSLSKNRDAARARQTNARRDLTRHARCLAGLEDVNSSDDNINFSGHLVNETVNLRKVVSGPGELNFAQVEGELGAAVVNAGDPDVEMDADEARDTYDESNAAQASVSTHTNKNSSNYSPGRQNRRRNSSAPGQWSKTNYSKNNQTNFGDSQFMRPEWMVDIPVDLWSGWCVVARPEGQRALVIASRGSTIARGKSGRLIKRFISALPGGSKKTRHGNDEANFCILDCVFHEGDETFYVLDCLAWNGVSLYDCACEMRLAWLHSKIGDPEVAECPEACSVDDGDKNQFRFLPLAVFDANGNGIRNAYETRTPYKMDGLIFLAKDGAYALGLSPLAILWKDDVISSHFLEENGDEVSDPEIQRIVLSLNAKTGDVVTGDATPTAFARLPMEYVAFEDGGKAQVEGGIRDNSLLRFKVGEGGIIFDETSGTPTTADLIYEGLANQKRRHGADVLTKIVFQYNARREPLTIKEIVTTVEEQSK